MSFDYLIHYVDNNKEMMSLESLKLSAPIDSTVADVKKIASEQLAIPAERIQLFTGGNRGIYPITALKDGDDMILAAAGKVLQMRILPP